MPFGSLMARAPQVVEMVEVFAHVVPASVTCVVVDDPVRGEELVFSFGETGNQHDRHPAAPRQPRKTAR